MSAPGVYLAVPRAHHGYTRMARPPVPRTLWAVPLGLLLLVTVSSLLAPPLPPPAGEPWPALYVVVFVTVTIATVVTVALFIAPCVQLLRLLYDLEGSIDDREAGDPHFRYITAVNLVNLALLALLAVFAVQLTTLIGSELRALEGFRPAVEAVTGTAARWWYLAHLTLYNVVLILGAGTFLYPPATTFTQIVQMLSTLASYLVMPLLTGAAVSVLLGRRDRERLGIEDREPTTARIGASSQATAEPSHRTAHHRTRASEWPEVSSGHIPNL